MAAIPDYAEWTQQQADLLNKGLLADADIENIALELELMGGSEKHALRSELRRLMHHLLKLQYQPDYPGRRSWLNSVDGARENIGFILDDSPSLKRLLPDYISKTYPLAAKDAKTQTGLDGFPVQCPYSLEQLLDDEFLPE